MKKFITILLASIMTAISGVFHKFYQNTAKQVLGFTELVKSVINNPELQIFVLATENKIDDVVLAAFRSIMNTLFPSDTGKPLTDEEIQQTLSEVSQNYPKELVDAMLHKIASSLVFQIKNGEVTQSDADMLISVAYSKFKRDVEQNTPATETEAPSEEKTTTEQ